MAQTQSPVRARKNFARVLRCLTGRDHVPRGREGRVKPLETLVDAHQTPPRRVPADRRVHHGAGGSSGPTPGVAEAGHGPPAHSSSSAAVLLYASRSPGFRAGGLHRPQPVGRAEARWSSQPEGRAKQPESRRSSSAPSAPGLGPDESRGHLPTTDQTKPTASLCQEQLRRHGVAITSPN